MEDIWKTLKPVLVEGTTGFKTTPYYWKTVSRGKKLGGLALGGIVKRNIHFWGNGYGGFLWNNTLFGLSIFEVNLSISTFGMTTTSHLPHSEAFGKEFLNPCLCSVLSLNSPWAVATNFVYGLTYGLIHTPLSIRFPRLSRLSILKESTISRFAPSPSKRDIQ